MVSNIFFPIDFFFDFSICFIFLSLLIYFIFQLIFIKRRMLFSCAAVFILMSVYFFVFFVFIEKEDFDRLIERDFASFFLGTVIFYSFLFAYYFFVLINKIFRTEKPLKRRTDVYPISLFCPAEETVQKALVKREQEKVYYALAAFILLIILSTVFYYFLYFFGGYRYTLISTWQVVSYGLTNSHFIPYGVVYLPLLYLVYKGSWKAAIIVYLCWFLYLSLMDKAYISFTEGKFFFLREAGREYISPYWDKALYFLRCFLLVYLARLLAVVCRVEHKRKSSQRL